MRKCMGVALDTLYNNRLMLKAHVPLHLENNLKLVVFVSVTRIHSSVSFQNCATPLVF